MTNEELIKAQNDFCGVTSFHNRGFKGKGIVVWNTESNSTHGKKVSQRILDSAPECTLIHAGLSLTTMGGVKAIVTYQGIDYDAEEFIKQNKIKLITRSIGGGTAIDTAESRYWNNLKKKYNLIFFNSAGNDGSKGAGGSFPPDVALYIAGATLVNGNPKRAWYSAIDPVNDFIAFVGWDSGTSFACPYFVGICALILSRYGDMSQDEFVEFCKKHILDMDIEGVDDYTGYGMVMLPEKTKVIIKENSTVMNVDGKNIPLEQPAIIDRKTGRMLVPIRAVTEAFGADVSWDNSIRSAVIEL